MEDVLYNAVLALTCVTQGSTKEKLYYELDLDTRLQKPWQIKLCFFYKFLKLKSPLYNGFYTSRSCKKWKYNENFI